MTQSRFRLIAAVFILLIENDQIFLAKRINTGWEDDTYSLPGGHLDGNETVLSAAVREAKEELSVTISPKDLRFVNVTHLFTNDERIHFAFVTNKWEGYPINNEPDKSDETGWFAFKNLPDNLNEVSRAVIKCYLDNIPYAEFGWEVG